MSDQGGELDYPALLAKYKRAMAALRFLWAHNPIKHDWDAYLSEVARWGMGIEAQPPDPLDYGVAPDLYPPLNVE